MAEGTNLTVYLPLGADQADIRAKLSDLAQAHNLGRGPGPLLVAIAAGEYEVRPAGATDESVPPANLVELLEHCAAMLEPHAPKHAEALRQKATLLGMAWSG